MTDAVRIDLGGADLARQLLDPICDVYDAVFSAPPFFWRDDESELHRERLLGLLEDPSYGVAVARVGDELVARAARRAARQPARGTGDPHRAAHGHRDEADLRTLGLAPGRAGRGRPDGAAPMFDVYLRDSLDDLRAKAQATL